MLSASEPEAPMSHDFPKVRRLALSLSLAALTGCAQQPVCDPPGATYTQMVVTKESPAYRAELAQDIPEFTHKRCRAEAVISIDRGYWMAKEGGCDFKGQNCKVSTIHNDDRGYYMHALDIYAPRIGLSTPKEEF